MPAQLAVADLAYTLTYSQTDTAATTVGSQTTASDQSIGGDAPISYAELCKTQLALTEGNWNFTLLAYNDTALALSAKITTKIHAGENKIVFALEEVAEGNGSVAITVSYPYDADVPANVTATLYAFPAGEAVEDTTKTFTSEPDESGETATFSYSLDAVPKGTYYAVFTFATNANDAAAVFSYPVFVIVAPGNASISRETIALTYTKPEPPTIVSGQNDTYTIAYKNNASNTARVYSELSQTQDGALVKLTFNTASLQTDGGALGLMWDIDETTAETTSKKSFWIVGLPLFNQQKEELNYYVSKYYNVTDFSAQNFGAETTKTDFSALAEYIAEDATVEYDRTGDILSLMPITGSEPVSIWVDIYPTLTSDKLHIPGEQDNENDYTGGFTVDLYNADPTEDNAATPLKTITLSPEETGYADATALKQKKLAVYANIYGQKSLDGSWHVLTRYDGSGAGTTKPTTLGGTIAIESEYGQPLNLAIDNDTLYLNGGTITVRPAESDENYFLTDPIYKTTAELRYGGTDTGAASVNNGVITIGDLIAPGTYQLYVTVTFGISGTPIVSSQTFDITVKNYAYYELPVADVAASPVVTNSDGSTTAVYTDNALATLLHGRTVNTVFKITGEGVDFARTESGSGSGTIYDIAQTLYGCNTPAYQYDANITLDLSEITGLTVLPGYQFNGMTHISAIVLPASLTTIEGYALCIGLSELSVPENVVAIGAGFVSGCVLKSLKIPAGTWYYTGDESVWKAWCAGAAIPAADTDSFTITTADAINADDFTRGEKASYYLYRLTSN